MITYIPSKEIREYLEKKGHVFSDHEKATLIYHARGYSKTEIFDSLRKWDVLQDLLEDDEITEIMVNGPEHIFIEKKGKLKRIDLKFECSIEL